MSLQNLFTPGEGKSKRQENFEKQYVDNATDFEPVFNEALSLTLKNTTPKKFRGRGFMASTMNWTLIGLLKERFPGRMHKDTHGRDYFLLNESTRIYFKKLDKKNCPNNIPTNHVRDMNCMRFLLNENPISVLYAGFRLREDKYWDDISCFLVEMKTMKKTNWVSSLSDLANRISAAETPINPITKAAIADELVVKAKAGKRKAGGDR